MTFTISLAENVRCRWRGFLTKLTKKKCSTCLQLQAKTQRLDSNYSASNEKKNLSKTEKFCKTIAFVFSNIS